MKIMVDGIFACIKQFVSSIGGEKKDRQPSAVDTSDDASTTPFWDRNLEDIENDFLPEGRKITDMPIQHSVDGIPVKATETIWE